MIDPELVVEGLRRIPRPDGGPDVVAEEERRPDGTIVLRHHLPDGHEVKTFVAPDVLGVEISVFYDGKLMRSW